MNRAVLQSHSRGLLIQQVPSTVVWITRYLLGGLLFGGGLFFFWLLFESPWSFYRDGGWAAVPQAVPGMFVAALMAALLGPLGGWILVTRARWRIDLSSRTLVDEVDWRIGHRATRYPIDDYRSLWLGITELSSSSGQRRGAPTMALCLQALPKEEDQSPRLTLAWFDRGASEAASRLAQSVSAATGLDIDPHDADAA